MGDLRQFAAKHRRTLKRFMVGAVIAFVVAAAAFVRVSESPRFCYTCHIMRPYYKAWEESTHKDVPCLECHYPPGVKSHVESKLRAASQVVQYITGSYGTRLWAEIDDNACLREGCHETRLLKGQVNFKGKIKFDHAFHLGEMPRGKKLRCTSCHSQIVVGTHIEVTPAVCFICHFKDAKLGEGTADCLLCHGPPTKPVEFKGITFDHTGYLKRGVDCTRCHLHVVEGNGEVPPAACHRCHADRRREATDPVKLHRVHVTDHKVECYECHEEIKHGSRELTPLLAPECAACHGGMHNVQEMVYLGTGGLDTPNTPSEMFEGNVSCAGCHTAGITIMGYSGGEASFPRAGGESCVACHGAGYDKMLARWQTETKKSFNRGKDLVARAKAAVYARGATAPELARARTFIAQAEQNLDLVARDESFGAHNIIYTNALIETAVVKAEAAARDAREPLRYERAAFYVPDDEKSCGARCHFGLERRVLTVGGKSFDHYAHVVGKNLECARCHDAERHGYTKPETYNCSGCHHVKGEVDCAKCHGDTANLKVVYHGRDFDHTGHARRAGFACATCHNPYNPAVVTADCKTCHHRPDVGKRCEDCHRLQGEVFAGQGAPAGEGKPAPMAKIGCKACHGQPPTRPTADVCKKCHPAGYAAVLSAWQNGIKTSYRDLSIRVKEAGDIGAGLAGVSVDGVSGKEIYDRARGDLSWVAGDGSWGVHNNEYLATVLKTDIKDLNELLKAVPKH